METTVHASPSPHEAVIRVEAPAVMVEVQVADKKGRALRDLRLDDFAVYEDDIPQRVIGAEVPGTGLGFGASLPTVSVAPAPAPSVRPSQPPDPLVRDPIGTSYVTLVIDLGDLQPANLKRVCDAAVVHAERSLAAEDSIAIYWIDDQLNLALPYSQDRQRAISATRQLCRRMPSGRLTALERVQTEREVERLVTEEEPLPNPGGMPIPPRAPFRKDKRREIAMLRRHLWDMAALQARSVLRSLRDLIQAFGKSPGRKSVIVVSEGFMHSPLAKDELQAVIHAALRANVAFYVVDAAGLTSPYTAASRAVRVRSEHERIGELQRNPGTGLTPFDWAENIALGLDNLQADYEQIASATGGELIKSGNDVLAGLRRGYRDLRERYTLVYQPTNKNYDGKFRRIKVEVRRPGVGVRHRLGYWADPPGEELPLTPLGAQVVAAVQSGAVKPAFVPKLNAALLLAPDAKFVIPICLSLPGGLVSFAEDEGQYRAALTLVLVARARDGRRLTVRQGFSNLRFDKTQKEDFLKRTLALRSRLAVPQCETVFLQAILAFADSTVAVAERHLAIEPGRASGPRLTSLLLSDRLEPAQNDSDPSDPLHFETVQIQLAPECRFSSRARITVCLGLLNFAVDSGPGQATFRLRFAVKTRHGFAMDPVIENIQTFPTPTPGSLRVLARLQLEGVTAGDSILEVQAEDVLGGGVASQQAAFVVE